MWLRRYVAKYSIVQHLKIVVRALFYSPKVSVKQRWVSRELSEFIDAFRSNYFCCDLVRIGGDGDGGYLVPKSLEKLKYCFSPGVGPVANFEQELSNSYGIKCFLADASVKSLPVENKNFQFIRKFLGNKTAGNVITLSDWIEQSIGKDTAPKILQMDIEGGEFDVLTFESVETLASFSVVVVEFHGMENVFDPYFLRMVSSIFQKFYKNFKIGHVHGNNCCGMMTINGVGIPLVFEVTFVRHDLIESCILPETVSLPHRLDQKNASDQPDVIMPEIWWRSSDTKTAI